MASFLQRWFTRVANNAPDPGGGGVTGDPNAIVRINAAGDGAATDPALTAAPLDPYGCPQIWDRRFNSGAGVGAKWRNGSWQADGDPANIRGEGLVIYKPVTAGTGSYGRVKGDRFGIFALFDQLAADPEPYAWRVDLDHAYMKNNADVMTYELIRDTGVLRVLKSLGIGPAGSEARILAGDDSPEGIVTGSPGDIYLRRDGGADLTLYVKETGAATNTGWVAYSSGGGGGSDLRDQLCCKADGTIVNASAGIASVTAPGSGQYNIVLANPLTIADAGPPIIPNEVIHFTAINYAAFGYLGVVDASNIRAYFFNYNGGVWNGQNVPFQLTIHKDIGVHPV